MSLSTMRQAVSMALWRGTDRIAQATEYRPHLRLAGMWWWHHGIGRGSFVAGAATAVFIAGASPARLAETASVAVAVWLTSLVAEAIHVIAYYDGQRGGDGCPLCTRQDGNGGDDGPDDDEPQPAPAGHEDHGVLPVRCPDFFADFEARVSATPAIREPRG